MKRNFYLIPAVALLLTSCGGGGSDTDTAAHESIEIMTALEVDSALNTPVADTANMLSDTIAEEEHEEEKPSLPEGVVAQCQTSQFGKLVFRNGGKLTSTKQGSGKWKKIGRAFSFSFPEIYSDFFILDGRLYEGTYNAAKNTREFEYTTSEGNLEMTTKKVKPSDGKPVKNLETAQ